MRAFRRIVPHQRLRAFQYLGVRRKMVPDIVLPGKETSCRRSTFD